MTTPRRVAFRLARILLVTGGLVLTGSVCGALLGAIIWILVLGPVHLEGVWLGVGFGAAIGAAIAPVTGWLLLRRVPLGQAVGWSAAGTLAGAVALLPVGGNAVLFGAITGFFTAAVVLREGLGRPPAAHARQPTT